MEIPGKTVARLGEWMVEWFEVHWPGKRGFGNGRATNDDL